MYDGYVPQSVKIEALTGASVTNNIVSSGSSVLLVFVSDNTIAQLGFRIRYDAGRYDDHG